MGLFDSHNSIFGGDSSGNDASGGIFGSGGDLFGKDGSGNHLKNLFGKDGSGNPLSGLMGGSLFDASGMDASGAFLQNIAQWVGTSLVAGLAVVLIFIGSQNLVYLTDPKQLSALPTNRKQPPYARDKDGGRLPPNTESTFLNNILYGYGSPYTFKDNPTVLPFIPCNFGFLRNMFGIKSWIGNTMINTWVNSRKFLKVVLGVLGGLPAMIQMPFAFVFMLLILLFTPLASMVFTFMASFHTNVGWSILGILFLLLMMVLIAVAQVLIMVWYLFISPLLSPSGRQFLHSQVIKYKRFLRLVPLLLFTGLSPLYLPYMYTIGLVIGFILILLF